MNYFNPILDYIQSRGVSDEHSEDNSLTKLLNLTSFITFIGGVFVFFVAIFLDTDPVYQAICLLVSLIYLVIIILHHFHKIKAAKIYFSIAMPFWISLLSILLGGNFGQSLISAVTIFVVFLIFKNQPRLRNFLMLVNIISYLGIVAFSYLSEPLLGYKDYPLDEVVTWFLCFTYMSIVFFVYEEKNEKHIATLEKKNKELKQKTIELERFTYIASHDLKSPLRNIVSFLNLIELGIKEKDYDELPEYIQYAENGAFQMNELISGVLEISKINSIEDSFLENVNLNKALDKAISNLQSEIEDSKAIIEAQKLPHHQCNKSDFILIFQNIIQNGIKYNHSEPPIISIYSTVSDKELIISIKDNGIGIKEKYHQQIFEHFKRLHTTREYKGTGLGLGLCKKIIEKYDGKIEIESKPDHYSIFSIKLPIKLNQ